MRTILLPALLLGACGGGTPIASGNVSANRMDPSTGAVARDLALPPRPVRIGETGASFPACAIRGVVANVGGAGTPLRNAPFDAAEAVDRLAEGTGLFVCTRSIDQRWIGVVVTGEDGSADCGVATPVDGAQDYDGPCRSGWLLFAHVRSRVN